MFRIIQEAVPPYPLHAQTRYYGSIEQYNKWRQKIIADYGQAYVLTAYRFINNDWAIVDIQEEAE